MDDDCKMDAEQQQQTAADEKSTDTAAAPKQKEAKQQQSQQQPNRRPALKGEDAWKRMNFLYQSAHHTALLQPRSLALNLSRFYLLNLRKVASKLVLRVDPAVKNTICKRCGALQLPGHTARNIVVHEESTVAPSDAAVSAEEAELLREWRQDQLQSTMQRTPALAGPASVQPPAAAPSASVEIAAASSSSSSDVHSTSRQRRLQRRAQASLANLAASDPTASASVSSTAAASVAPAAASSISTAAPTAAASAVGSVAPPTSPRSSITPLASALRRRLRRKRRIHVRPTPPHVLTECLLCNTRKRMHTKPPKQRPGGA